MTEIETIRRRVSPAQRQRRQKIVAAASRLMAEGGAAISMEAVAVASGVSRASLYRYYTSREHLLAEVTLEAGSYLLEHLRRDPPAGATVGEKLSTLLRLMIESSRDNERLLAGCVNNLSSQDPAVLAAYQQIEALLGDILGSVVPGAVPGSTVGILFRHLFGGFVLATSGKIGFEELEPEAVELCRLLFSDDWDRPA